MTPTLFPDLPQPELVLHLQLVEDPRPRYADNDKQPALWPEACPLCHDSGWVNQDERCWCSEDR